MMTPNPTTASPSTTGSPPSSSWFSRLFSRGGTYQLLDPSVIRNRPRIGIAMLALTLFLITFLLAASSNRAPANPSDEPSGGATKNNLERAGKNKNKPLSVPRTPSPVKAIKAWYSDDPVGMDPVPNKDERTSIWQYEISLEVNASRTEKQRKHPEIAFIKGLEVGGTSVSIALDRVARRYGIKLQEKVSEMMNRELDSKFIYCTDNGALWFHHGFKNTWMRRCTPSVRFITLLRDPVEQALSFEELSISKGYYPHYPAKECNESKHIPIALRKNVLSLSHMLQSVDHCRDAPFRKNVTIQLVAHAVTTYQAAANDHNGYPGPAVELSTDWILGENHKYGRLTADDYINYLKTNYFMVGVTERLNEFLVLLALHMGWDPAQLYYLKCKPVDSPITVEEFAKYFPQLFAKLKVASAPVRAAYEWAKKDFDDHVRRLGGWFQTVLKDFESGLQKYQEKHRATQLELLQDPMRWGLYRYHDHHSEFC